MILIFFFTYGLTASTQMQIHPTRTSSVYPSIRDESFLVFSCTCSSLEKEQVSLFSLRCQDVTRRNPNEVLSVIRFFLSVKRKGNFPSEKAGGSPGASLFHLTIM